MNILSFVQNQVRQTIENLRDLGISCADFQKCISDKSEIILRPNNISYYQTFLSSPSLKASSWSVDEGIITCKANLDELSRAKLENSLIALKPWRKGPFKIGDVLVDAEWKSNLKWNRISTLPLNLENKTILDLGCGNGYYMYRMKAENPKLVLGMDPTFPFYFQFLQLNKYFQASNVFYLPFGWEDTHLISHKFDYVFCMGVLYHHKNPKDLLRQLKSLTTGIGKVVLETIVLPDNETTVLIPEKKYAGMRNVYHIPSLKTLKYWCEEIGAKIIDHTTPVATNTIEQRSTKWSSPVSFVNHLNSLQTHTIEGYPVPHRAIIIFS